MKKKKLLRKICLLVILFVGVVACVLFLLHKDEKVEVLPEEMAQASLPIVTPKVENSAMNALHGYTQEMDASSMRDTITPLPANRALELTIDLYGQSLTGISYEIRSLDLERLVENTQIQDYTVNADKDTVSVTLPIQDLLEKDSEYQLIVVLDIKGEKRVYYYTRVILSDNLPTGDMAGFVLNFHNKTLDAKQSSTLAQYLKTTSKNKNSDTYGNVSLSSTYKQLTWGDLSPKETTTPKLDLTEVNSSIGTFRLDTQVKIKDDNGKEQLYQVEETYCVQTIYSSWYVLAFNRTVNQVFTGDENVVKDGNINFGVLSDGAIQTTTSTDGNTQVFTLDGDLWMYSTVKEKVAQASTQTTSASSDTETAANESQAQTTTTGGLVRVFSFKQKDTDVRADYNRHAIKVVNTDDNGDIDFLLYGYMNRGTHEGEIGLTFYHYNQANEQLEEIFYLSYNKSYELLQEEIGKLSYINKNGLFYLMVNHKIYAIDFEGNESVIVVDQIKDDSLVISSNSSAIAWQEQENDYGAKQLQVLYLEDGHQNTIAAEDNEDLRALGFIDEDFIYGIVSENDINKVKDTATVPMYALQIVNKDGSAESRYEENNIYISNIVSEAGSVIINRVKISSKGALKEIDSDALIQNEAVTSVQEQDVTSGTSNRLMSVWTLAANTSNYTGSYATITKILIKNSDQLNIDMTSNKDDTAFYAYADGYLQGVYTKVSEAVATIYDDIGCVIDQKGNYVYRRGYRDYRTIVVPQKTASGYDESLQACLESIVEYEGASIVDIPSYLESNMSAQEVLQKILPGHVYNLEGCSLEQIVYYYNSYSQPLLGRTADGYVVICGVDSAQVKWYNPITQAIVVQSLEDAESTFSSEGNIFIGYLK